MSKFQIAERVANMVIDNCEAVDMFASGCQGYIDCVDEHLIELQYTGDMDEMRQLVDEELRHIVV